MKFYRTIIVAVVLLLPSAAFAGDLLAGDAGQIWLVRPTRDEKSCDVFVKSLGGSWQAAVRNQSPAPTTVVAAGETLHLFYADRQHVVISPNGNFRVADNLPGKLIAACSGRPLDNAESDSSTVYVLVRRNEPPADPAAKTQPSSAPETTPMKGLFPCLYRLAGNSWVLLGTGVSPRKPSDVPPTYLAVLKGKIYRLRRRDADDAKSPFALQRFAPDAKERMEWTNVHAFAAGQTPLGMIALKDRLCIVHTPEASDVATAPAKLSLMISRYLPAIQTPYSSQPVAKGRNVAHWPADAPPKIARLGEQIGLLWQDDNTTTLFALCSPAGTLGAEENVTRALGSVPDLEGAGSLFNYFLMAILVVVCIGMFFRRRRTPPKPFLLPTGLVPGNLVKRLIAANIDFTPFFLIAIAVFGVDVDAFMRLVEEPQSVSQGVLVSSLYAAMLSLGLYVVYGTIAEMCFGLTLGKWILRLRTVQEDGRRPGLREASLRNATKVIELSMLHSPMAWLLMIFVLLPLLSRNRQRLGDMIARTAVVEAASLEMFRKAVVDGVSEYQQNANLANPETRRKEEE